ncbi:hypothetical protein EV356DRAFT_495678 [Viridothelium virens]|uniref:Uncharacterized protein n=1 Tax=Viridothelium virens TaxID=1048519 RepID=A0A6A6HNZ3_VIRVR|nr:hypothetical protein EV356DRAFT_495678 [Viridothelium virens]
MASSDSHNGDQTAREEIQENQCRELSESRRRLKRRWEAREASPDTSLGRYQRGKERKTRDREDRIRLFEDRGKNRKKSKGTSLDIVVYEESEQQQFVAWFVHLIDWAPIYNDYDQENVEVGLDGQATEPLQQDPTGHVSAKAEEDRSSADNERQIPNTAVHVVQQMGPNVQEQPPPTIPSLFGPFSTEANVVPLAAFDRNRLNGHGLR